MRIYLRYLLWQLALPALLATAALSGAVWLSQSLRFVDLIVNKGLPVSTFLYLTLLLFPSLLLIILPFAVFSAVLFAYHRLIQESELTVMKAVGLSNWQLARPGLVLATLVTLFGYAISLYFMPLAFRGFKDLQFEIRRDFSYVLLQAGVFNTLVDGLTVYVRERRPDASLAGILVHDERNPKLPVTMTARQGVLVRGDDGPLFVLEAGSRQELDLREPQRPDLSILHFEHYTLDLATGAGSPDRRGRSLEEFYLHELLYPQREGISESGRREMIAEGHKRLTWPLNTLVFALVGLAALLSHRFDRQGPRRRTLIAVILVIALQALNMAAANLAARSLSMVPLLYVFAMAPGLAALLVLADRPSWSRLLPVPLKAA